MSENQGNRRKDDQKDPWYVDKRIPLGVMLAFLFQGSAIIWYAASESAKIGQAPAERRTTLR